MKKVTPFWAEVEFYDRIVIKGNQWTTLSRNKEDWSVIDKIAKLFT